MASRSRSSDLNSSLSFSKRARASLLFNPRVSLGSYLRSFTLLPGRILCAYGISLSVFRSQFFVELLEARSGFAFIQSTRIAWVVLAQLHFAARENLMRVWHLALGLRRRSVRRTLPEFASFQHPDGSRIATL